MPVRGRSGGRRPKPTVLHKLEGTFEPKRHGKGREREAIAIGDLKDPPIDFTVAQTELWRECVANAPAGVLKLIDKKVLAVFVEAADRHNTARACQALLDSDAQLQLLVKGSSRNGSLVPSPYNKILDKTADIILRASDRLGFNPTTRPRIKVDQEVADARAEKTTDNPWDQLRVIDGGKP